MVSAVESACTTLFRTVHFALQLLPFWDSISAHSDTTTDRVGGDFALRDEFTDMALRKTGIERSLLDGDPSRPDCGQRRIEAESSAQFHIKRLNLSQARRKHETNSEKLFDLLRLRRARRRFVRMA